MWWISISYLKISNRTFVTSLPNCVLCVPKTCSRANQPCVFTCSRDNVPCMLTCSCANLPCVLKCSRANVPSVPTRLTCSLINELTCLACLPAHISTCFTWSRVPVLTCQLVLHFSMLTCQRALSANALPCKHALRYYVLTCLEFSFPVVYLFLALNSPVKTCSLIHANKTLYWKNIAQYATEITELQWNIFTTYFIHKFYKTNKFFIWIYFYYKTF